MTRSVQAVLFVWMCFGFGGLAYAADPTDQQAVAKLEHDWNEAWTKKDKATLEKILVEDFTFTDENGNVVRSRSQYIDGILKGPKVVEYKYSEEIVKVYGNTAVGTGRWTGKVEGDSLSSDTRYTDTLTKGVDGWKGVATQDTKISK